MKPKVSILVPTYNGEKFIERAIKSVLFQTFKNWEMIIVDDGSKDKTAEIIKFYLKKEKRIRFFKLKKNTGGPAIPRTIAYKKARGEYISFLDQDDIFYPENLELRVKYLDNNPKINILLTLAWAFDEETKKIINYEHGGPVNLMVRKEVVKYGEYFKPEQNGVDEIGMLYRYFLREEVNFKKQALLTSEPLSLYSRHLKQNSYVENKNPFSFVNRINSLLEDFQLETIIEDGINRENSLFRFIFISNKIWYSRLGNFYCLASNFRKGREAFIKSLKLKFNLFSFVFLLFSFLGFKNYRRLEYLLRIIQRKVFWTLKVFYYKNKFKESYNKALKILRSL